MLRIQLGHSKKSSALISRPVNIQHDKTPAVLTFLWPRMTVFMVNTAKGNSLCPSMEDTQHSYHCWHLLPRLACARASVKLAIERTSQNISAHYNSYTGKSITMHDDFSVPSTNISLCCGNTSFSRKSQDNGIGVTKLGWHQRKTWCGNEGTGIARTTHVQVIKSCGFPAIAQGTQTFRGKSQRQWVGCPLHIQISTASCAHPCLFGWW